MKRVIEEVPVMIAGHRWWSWIHDAGYGQFVAVCEPAKSYFSRPQPGVFGFDFLHHHKMIERTNRLVIVPPDEHATDVWRAVDGRQGEVRDIMRALFVVPLVGQGAPPLIPPLTPSQTADGYARIGLPTADR